IFINSVVDDLEFHQRLSPPHGLFKKRNFLSQLSHLTHFFGSGSIDLGKREINNGAHSLFSVGLASYALEVFHQTRYKIRWNEPSPRIVKLSLDANRELPPPNSVEQFPWSEMSVERSLGASKPVSNLLVMKEEGHLEIDGERYMILPASLLNRFFSTCLPHVPDLSEVDWIQGPTDWSKTDLSMMSVIISSVVELFSVSERAVYITGKESWDAYLRTYLSEDGWGGATVLEYDSQSFSATFSFSQNSITPFSIGLVAGIWERAHGRKFKLNLRSSNGSIQVDIRSLLEYKNEL
ncbi:MAG: hypothetical protein L7U53_02620, partial [Candidatus Poseidoniaceae archaeon]|nr:hypothetical protein [Candidatus Poseidoniaceae archaeon]